jgi:multiple antibiotic resistance protein
MDHSATFFAAALASFFAIMNPVANTPLFLGLTQQMDEKTTRQVARRAVVLAFVIVAVFSTAGKYIWSIFGVTLPAFRIAGGLLVGLVGFHLLQGEHSSVHKP